MTVYHCEEWAHRLPPAKGAAVEQCLDGDQAGAEPELEVLRHAKLPGAAHRHDVPGLGQRFTQRLLDQGEAPLRERCEDVCLGAPGNRHVEHRLGRACGLGERGERARARPGPGQGRRTRRIEVVEPCDLEAEPPIRGQVGLLDDRAGADHDDRARPARCGPALRQRWVTWV